MILNGLIGFIGEIWLFVHVTSHEYITPMNLTTLFDGFYRLAGRPREVNVTGCVNHVSQRGKCILLCNKRTIIKINVSCQRNPLAKPHCLAH